jgi:hypothetical protein
MLTGTKSKARNQGRSPPRHRVAAPSAMRFWETSNLYRGFSDLAAINQAVRKSQSQGRGHSMALSNVALGAYTPKHHRIIAFCA